MQFVAKIIAMHVWLGERGAHTNPKKKQVF